MLAFVKGYEFVSNIVPLPYLTLVALGGGRQTCPPPGYFPPQIFFFSKYCFTKPTMRITIGMCTKFVVVHLFELICNGGADMPPQGSTTARSN